MIQNRRSWIRHTATAVLGVGFSLPSMGNEERILRSFGTDKGLVNLGANENPYGIAPLATKAIQEMLVEANRYSFNIAGLQHCRKEIAAHFNLSEEQMLLTAGSTESLGLLPRIFNKGNLVTAVPTFNTLPSTARTIRMPVVEVPLTNDKVHDLPALLKAINQDTSLVYIVNPANPTATVLDPARLREFIEEIPSRIIIILDEAYIDFPRGPYNQSMLPLIEKKNNLIVLRTFSKIHAMAGLRVGFLASNPDLIRLLEEDYFDHSQFAISNLSLTAALASLKDDKHRTMSREKNEAAREYTYQELTKMKFRCIPSATNFIFFHLGNYPGDFSKDMLNRNILLRSNAYTDGKWARVSIGTMEEMKYFITRMKEQFKV